MDASPIKTLTNWLEREAWSIPPQMERKTDISDLKARIASGEYSLDAGAIAEAMFGRAEGATAPPASRSEMLEAGEGDSAPGAVE
jgi:hypothetical protein